eukprot:8697787-Pyramimonas_sp.AAC.1
MFPWGLSTCRSGRGCRALRPGKGARWRSHRTCVGKEKRGCLAQPVGVVHNVGCEPACACGRWLGCPS